MSDVTRHDFTCFPPGRVIDLDRDEGKYVLHSNYSALLARHAALVEAAKPVAAWWRKERMVAEPPYQIEHLVLGTDGPECVGVDELDALAALVGEG